ncbi:HAD hydrolase-like protein [Akkermansiaceae bacterium]|nr:HAD hydrolase-like protein [Akkermansiaceae bacterium]
MMVKNILWDFDGVILDSMSIRDWGFREIFKDFDKNEVEALINFHRLNGGRSRYVKIRYFFENILGKSIKEERVLYYAELFSGLMKKELVDRKNLISDSVMFIISNFKNFNFHIVSGSDQIELRFLCKRLGIEKYFRSIEGSPTCKNILVGNLLEKFKYYKDDTILIGDSVNDHDAAVENGIRFFGYNNVGIKSVSSFYIESFEGLGGF